MHLREPVQKYSEIFFGILGTGEIEMWIDKDFWLSYKGHTVDALALEGDEGRGNLR